ISRCTPSAPAATSDEKIPFVRDETLLHALDLLILYLRMVHSIDFYGHIEYPNEDAMPNRCGMLHVRGVLPTQFGSSEDGTKLVSTKFNTEFINGFNHRLESGLMQASYVTPDEMEKMGKKDGDKEVEAFIQANTVELAQDKWLCPLSGKKFKGPDFIRKHLTSKHDEKLREVREEATFYNNYLADPNRPANVEVKPGPAPPREEERREDRYQKIDNETAAIGTEIVAIRAVWTAEIVVTLFWEVVARHAIVVRVSHLSRHVLSHLTGT
ncbi:Arsenite-resistance protein 2, partial [Ostertagia ostertagi]